MALTAGRSMHLLVDNRAALLFLHRAAAARQSLRLRPWQLTPNGDLQHAAALAIGRMGGVAVRAAGIKSHTDSAALGPVWAPRPLAEGNEAADLAASAVAGHLDEAPRAYVQLQGARAEVYASTCRLLVKAALASY
eukprot:12871547-Alexandrium_andersonii.AAC.1